MRHEEGLPTGMCFLLPPLGCGLDAGIARLASTATRSVPNFVTLLASVGRGKGGGELLVHCDPALGGFKQGSAGLCIYWHRHPLAKERLGFTFGEAQTADVQLIATILLALFFQAGW